MVKSQSQGCQVTAIAVTGEDVIALLEAIKGNDQFCIHCLVPEEEKATEAMFHRAGTALRTIILSVVGEIAKAHKAARESQ